MQTVSVPQNSQITLAESANKVDIGPGKPVDEAGNTPFQKELSKQVQAKQSASEKGLHHKPVNQERSQQDVSLKSHVAKPLQLKEPKLKADLARDSALSSESVVGDSNLLAETASSAKTVTDIALPSADIAIIKSVDDRVAEHDAMLAAMGINLTESNPILLANLGPSPITASQIDLAKESLDDVTGKALRSESSLASELNASAILSSPAASSKKRLEDNGDEVGPKFNLGSELKHLEGNGDEVDSKFNVTSELKHPALRADNVAQELATGTKQNGQSRLVETLPGNPVLKVPSNDGNAMKFTTATIQENNVKEVAASLASQPQPAQFNNNVALQQSASATVIDLYPGKSGWDQAISQKVIYMVGAGQQSATLTLNPPDLGPLKVVVQVHNNQADTTFISDNDEVRRALESGLSHLREKMSESGIQLGQANINSSHQSQQEFQQAAQNRILARLGHPTDQGSAEVAGHSQATVRVANGLVDTFA